MSCLKDVSIHRKYWLLELANIVSRRGLLTNSSKGRDSAQEKKRGGNNYPSSSEEYKRDRQDQNRSTQQLSDDEPQEIITINPHIIRYSKRDKKTSDSTDDQILGYSSFFPTTPRLSVWPNFSKNSSVHRVPPFFLSQSPSPCIPLWKADRIDVPATRVLLAPASSNLPCS